MKGFPNEFLLTIQSVADGTRPTANYGTSVTPGNLSYGTYAQLLAGAAVTDEIWEVEIIINTVGISATARDCLVTIGLDPAGGTSYTDFIVDLLGSCAANYTTSGTPSVGVVYRFPVRIPSGASVAAKAMVNSATVTAIRVACVLRGQPTRPDITRRGTFVTSLGTTPASASGTAITPGGASEGAWTQIGSALATPLWFFDFGWGVNNSTMANDTINVDIGIGDVSNQRVIIANAPITTTALEAVQKMPLGRYAVAAVGDLLYARAQDSGASTGNSVAVYGVGGFAP